MVPVEAGSLHEHDLLPHQRLTPDSKRNVISTYRLLQNHHFELFYGKELSSTPNLQKFDFTVSRKKKLLISNVSD